MKLAEALQERSDLNIRIARIKQRLSHNALVQEGEQPAENPAELLKELNQCLARLEVLINGINHANCVTMCDGESLTSLIAKRDVLTAKAAAYNELLTAASDIYHRTSRSEIKYFSTVDVKSLQSEIDTMSKHLRETNNKIQMINWTTDIEL